MHPSEPPRADAPSPAATPVALVEIARQWGRIGCVGFGGPPSHILLLRELCVERRRWMGAAQFERAIAAVNLLPGPASTQLAIYCAWRLRGRPGAVVGGLGFILPGLIVILALAAAFLSGSPPRWLLGAGAGAGAAVPAVAIGAGLAVSRPLWARTRAPLQRRLLLAYGLVGAISAATVGPLLALVLVGCGLIELARGAPGGGDADRRAPGGGSGQRPGAAAALLAPLASLSVGRPSARALLRLPLAALAAGQAPAIAWTALKVGGLAFGGGFVIVPLMQADAVGVHHWMTHAQFLDAVALGQVTPGPVTQTVAAVGYAAGGLAGGLLAAAVAFAPSFAFVLLGASHFGRLLRDPRAAHFIGGAAPAAAGAIIGSAGPLAFALSSAWQYALLGAAAVALLLARRGVLATLLSAGAAGAVIVLAGGPLPG